MEHIEQDYLMKYSLNKESFRTSYTNVGLGGFNDEKTIDVLYVLLYSRRANDAVMSSDESRFIYDLFGTVFKFGAEFEKKIEIQSQILSLSADELERGTTTVYNRSENPIYSSNSWRLRAIKEN